MTGVEFKDRLLLLAGQPPIARHQAIVLVSLAVTVAPLVEFAGAQLEPGEQPLLRKLGAILPVLDVIDDLVASIVGNPASF